MGAVLAGAIPVVHPLTPRRPSPGAVDRAPADVRLCPGGARDGFLRGFLRKIEQIRGGRELAEDGAQVRGRVRLELAPRRRGFSRRRERIVRVDVPEVLVGPSHGVASVSDEIPKMPPVDAAGAARRRERAGMVRRRRLLRRLGCKPGARRHGGWGLAGKALGPERSRGAGALAQDLAVGPGAGRGRWLRGCANQGGGLVALSPPRLQLVLGLSRNIRGRA